MTETLELRRLRVRYRLGRDDPALRRRLDAVLDRVLGEGLEAALARCGVPREEEICVRSLQVPHRVRLGDGEAGAAAAWSTALAAAIAEALAAGPGPNLVRYRSRRAALADLAHGVATLRFERAWAWRQLGLWRSGDAPGDRGAAVELLTALADEPGSIVPVLAGVAAAGELPQLAGRIDPQSWLELARRALAAAGAPGTVLDAAGEPGTALDFGEAPGALPAGPAAEPRQRLGTRADEEPREDGSPAPPSRIADAIRRSAIGRAAPAALGSLAGSGREAAVALAALAWLDAFPDAASRLTPDTVRALARTLDPATADEQPHDEVHDEQPPAEVVDPPAAARPPAESPLSGERPEEPEIRWTTAFGGLLFLLGVLDEVGLPDGGPLARRPLRWTLHRLALTLVPAGPRDPAALAFAGLPPDAEPPEDGSKPWGDEELDALADLRARLEDRLRTRLERPDARAGELVDLVCRREAEIVVDPGWIEVRLPLEEVSTELRRAGLDLDPGWLPWLGALVRFVYG